MIGTYIAHHGIKGQKWGVRNYQNPDGSYTAAGKARYGDNSVPNNSKSEYDANPVSKNAKSSNSSTAKTTTKKRISQRERDYRYESNRQKEKTKKYGKAAAAQLVAAFAAAGLSRLAFNKGYTKAATQLTVLADVELLASFVNVSRTAASSAKEAKIEYDYQTTKKKKRDNPLKIKS